MPFKWITPDLFMEYKGVRVYHVYKEDDYECPLDSWFTTDIDEDPRSEFSAKGKEQIKEMIDNGEIKNP